VFENQNQDSLSSAENAKNSIELIDETILSNQKIEFLNSLIMIDRRNKIRHDYKQLHTREFAKAAKFVIAASHQIATLSTYEKAISRSQVNQ
jgi:alkyl hydroperoxide reductase subunit AhpC